MPRDAHTHEAIKWFAWSLLSADVISTRAEQPSDHYCEHVAQVIRGFVALFDHEDAWEDMTLRPSAIAIAERLEARKPPPLPEVDPSLSEPCANCGHAARVHTIYAACEILGCPCRTFRTPGIP